MKRALVLFVVLLYCRVSMSASYVPPTEEEIAKMQGIELTSDSFTSTLKKSGSLLVQFHSATCAHCRKFQPQWFAAAKALSEKVTVARVDVDREKALAEAWKITSTPSVKLFVGGSTVAVDYHGPMKATNLVKFVFRKTEPVLILNTNEEVDGFISSWGTAVIGYFSDRTAEGKDWTTEWKNFRQCANDPRTEEFGFGILATKALGMNYTVYSSPSVTIYRTYDGTSIRPVPAEWKDLCGWVLKEGTPVIEEFDSRKYQKALLDGKPIGLLYLDPKKAARCETLLDNLKDKSELYRNRMKFLFVWDGPSMAKDIRALGGAGTMYPTFIIQDPFKKQNYPFDDNTWATKLDIQQIEEWIQKFFAGRLRPKAYYYGYTLGVNKHNHPHVVKVTGKTFNDIVMDRTKDVIIEFYDPNCKHCKAFNPMWELLGEVLCDVDTVVVAQMDAINNDIPPGILIGMNGFPTIHLFPARYKRQPVLFDSKSKTVLDIVLFLQKHASIPFDTPSIDFSEAELKKQREVEQQSTHKMQHVMLPLDPIFTSEHELEQMKGMVH